MERGKILGITFLLIGIVLIFASLNATGFVVSEKVAEDIKTVWGIVFFVSGIMFFIATKLDKMFERLEHSLHDSSYVLQAVGSFGGQQMYLEPATRRHFIKKPSGMMVEYKPKKEKREI